MLPWGALTQMTVAGVGGGGGDNGGCSGGGGGASSWLVNLSMLFAGSLVAAFIYLWIIARRLGERKGEEEGGIRKRAGEGRGGEGGNTSDKLMNTVSNIESLQPPTPQPPPPPPIGRRAGASSSSVRLSRPAPSPTRCIQVQSRHDWMTWQINRSIDWSDNRQIIELT